MTDLKHKVTIEKVERVAPDILHFTTERPNDYEVVPGHAVMLGIPDSGQSPGPFSPTSSPDDPYLEFYIKIYRQRDGLTDQIEECKPGSLLEISDHFGKIDYKGEGAFFAAGTGITPFLALLRHLKRQNMAAGNELYYSEKKRVELIQEEEFREILGDNAHFILTENEFDPRRIDAEFLEEHITVDATKMFYICGPLEFEDEVADWLRAKDVDDSRIIREDR